jgi:hypothetical protein
MSRHAVMEGDLVVNVILWDGEQPFEGTDDTRQIPDDSPVGIGWALDGDEWIAPVVEEAEVSQATLDQEAERIAARRAALQKFAAFGLTEADLAAVLGI